MGRAAIPSVRICRPSAPELAGPSQTLQTGHSRCCEMTSKPASPMATHSGTGHQSRRRWAGAPPLHACAVFLTPANARSSARADHGRPSSPGQICCTARTGARVGRARFRILHDDRYPATATPIPFYPSWREVEYRADDQDDWHDIPAQKTAWGTDGEHGWWEVSLRATHDDRISVKLRGRMVKVSYEVGP